MKRAKSFYQQYFNSLLLFLFLSICHFPLLSSGQSTPVSSAYWTELRPLIVSDDVVLCTASQTNLAPGQGGLFLATFSAEVLDTLHLGTYSLLTHKSAHFIAINGEVFRYSQGALMAQFAPPSSAIHTLIAPPDGLSEILYLAVADETLVLGLSDSAIVVETPFTVLELSYTDGALYAIGELAALRISLSDYEVNAFIPFPENHTALRGSATGTAMLLREVPQAAEHLGRFKLFDMSTEAVTTLTGPSGNEKLLPYQLTSAQSGGDYIYLTGVGPDPYTGLQEQHYGMYAARVNAMNGVVDLADVFSEVNADLNLTPRLALTSSTALIFGIFSKQGGEPHEFRDGELEIVRDIYPGFGSSISPTQQPFLNHERIYFTAVHPSAGHSLWTTKGSAESTFAISLLPNANNAVQIAVFPQTEGTHGHVLVQEDGGKKLYRFDPLAEAIDLPLPEEEKWDIGYASTGLGNLFLQPTYTSAPPIGIADDGSIALLHKGLPTMLDYAAQNSPNVWQRKTLVFYSTGYVLVHDQEGHLTGSFRFDQNNNAYSTMARDAVSGKMIVAVKHTGNTTYLGDVPYQPGSDGYFMVGLAADASVEWIKFYPTGYMFIIEAMKYADDELFMAGAFAGALSINGVDMVGIAPNLWQPFAARMDVSTQDFTWLRMLPLPQSSFFGGAFLMELEIDQKALFLVTGGSSRAENLNCKSVQTHVQIARLSTTTGATQWTNVLRSQAGIRPMGLINLSNGALYATGMAYGDLNIEGLNLKKSTVAHEGCSTESFLMGISAATGDALSLTSTDFGSGAIPQAMLPADEGFSVLSLTPEEQVTQNSNGTWSAPLSLETNLYSPSARLLSSHSQATTLLTGSGRENLIATVAISAALHTEDAMILAGGNLQHGALGGSLHRPARQHFDLGGSIIVQRRPLIYSNWAPDISLSDASNGLSIYPNPSSRIVAVNLPLSDDNTYTNLSIYDLAGRRVRSIPISPAAKAFMIDISDLPSGMYVINMEGAEMRSGKLLVQRQ